MEKTFEIAGVLEAARRAGAAWHEFLRVPALSMGVYRLAAGAEDPQSPHAEDEVYYVLSGRGRLRVEGRDHAVAPGALLFVPARAVHAFREITEELTLLVFFAPAEGSTEA